MTMAIRVSGAPMLERQRLTGSRRVNIYLARPEFVPRLEHLFRNGRCAFHGVTRNEHIKTPEISIARLQCVDFREGRATCVIQVFESLARLDLHRSLFHRGQRRAIQYDIGKGQSQPVRDLALGLRALLARLMISGNLGFPLSDRHTPARHDISSLEQMTIERAACELRRPQDFAVRQPVE